VIRARTTDVDLAPSLFKDREMRGTSGPAMMDNERACRLSRTDVISGVKNRGHAPFVSFYREKPAGGEILETTRASFGFAR